MIFSVGHSSLAPDEFEALLAAAPVAAVWDIRSYPSSHWPWFARDALQEHLAAAGVSYRWVRELGGRRRAPARPAPPPAPAAAPPDGTAAHDGALPQPVAPEGSPPTPVAPPDSVPLTLFAAPAEPEPRWRSEGFENYMWYMAGDEFLAAAGELLLAGRRGDLAILCAEALWWRCHRSMVADYVVYAGGEVVHLQPERTAHSAVIGDRLTRYAPEVIAAWDRRLALTKDQPHT